MASMFNSVPVLTLQARIIGLYSREGYEIGEDVSSIDASNSIIITDRNRNLFMLIFFRSKDGAFGLQEINGLRNNMVLVFQNHLSTLELLHQASFVFHHLHLFSYNREPNNLWQV